ncbi:MAG: hypothetical protein D6806_18305 [Deltaproteobacteria bacterium]|nr:MAG: hypothetical protein D6806_18305 [Deltaproteobacteria bacterium]
MDASRYEFESLTVERLETADSVRIKFLGKSMAREPAKQLLPVLTDALERCTQTGKTMVLDFTKVEYMNSSTITPVIRLIERVRRGSGKLEVRYNKNLKWQEVSFSALDVFATEDGRVKIVGQAN